MVSPWLETIEFAIQHVRHRGQRMPVTGMHMSEGPLDPVKSKTASYPWILIDVLMIIVIDELVAKRLAEDDRYNCYEKNADPSGLGILTVNLRNRTRNCDAPRSFFP